MCEKPTTSQHQTNPIVDHTEANDLIDIVVADSVQTDERNSCHTTETFEQESVGAVSSNLCERADDGNICINSNANLDEQQLTPTFFVNSSQLLQPKLEQMENDATIGQNRKQKSNEPSDHYYRRKIFKKEKESTFQVDKLVGEWDESDCEQQKSQYGKDTPNPNESHDMDTISIASGTSDSEFAFVGDPYYFDSDQKPSKTSDQ